MEVIKKTKYMKNSHVHKFEDLILSINIVKMFKVSKDIFTFNASLLKFKTSMDLFEEMGKNTKIHMQLQRLQIGNTTFKKKNNF